MSSNLDRAASIAASERQERLQKYRDKSADALARAISRRCRTIFIGCLDSIEQKFGYQWGIGKSLSDLSDRERLFFELWKSLRKEILDKSNNQTKQLLREVECFTVALKPQHYDIHFVNNGDND